MTPGRVQNTETSLMGELMVGAETTIIVQRDGKPEEMKIMPGSRD